MSGNEEFLIIASDGIWEFLSNKEVINIYISVVT